MMKHLRVANGLVQGQIKRVSEREIVEFLAIPYCKPPVNELRFQKSQLFESCSDKIINKLQFETCPPQLLRRIFDGKNEDEETWIPKEKQDEDCLYVNVWCPLEILNGDECHPVLVWIYGGGFVSGSSSLNIYNGSVLASQENIIVVSFNYRIGMLGFLCLDDDLMKGNLGIGDQVLALQWIHENIKVFNGNPNNITICGNSAGGCSVSLHLLIEESWKYFQKVIMLSGVSFSDWGFIPKKELIRRSEKAVNKILEKFNFSIKWNEKIKLKDKKSIINFLQLLDYKEFLDETDIVNGILQFAWAPCVDGELVTRNPRDLFRTGKHKKCPTIFLNVENEANYFIICRFPQIEIDSEKLVDMKYFRESYEFYPNFPIPCDESIREKIKSEYNLLDNTLSISTLDKIISYQFFISGSLEMVNILSRSNKETYYLWFKTFSPSPHWPEWCGIMHGEEIYYLFGHAPEYCKSVMENFGLFIKNGTLPKELLFYNEDSRNYISIDKNNWVNEKFSDEEFRKVKFWENLRMKSEYK